MYVAYSNDSNDKAISKDKLYIDTAFSKIVEILVLCVNSYKRINASIISKMYLCICRLPYNIYIYITYCYVRIDFALNVVWLVVYYSIKYTLMVYTI